MAALWLLVGMIEELTYGWWDNQMHSWYDSVARLSSVLDSYKLRYKPWSMWGHIMYTVHIPLIVLHGWTLGLASETTAVGSSIKKLHLAWDWISSKVFRKANKWRYWWMLHVFTDALDLHVNILHENMYSWFVNWNCTANPLQSISGITSPIQSVAFNNTENWIGAGSKSGIIKVFDLEENKS